MNRNLILMLMLSISILSCNRIANKTKEGINKGGEMVGETATEFFEGVSEGVDKTLECDIILSKDLIKKGLKTGVYDINGMPIGRNNKLTLYIIFEKDFNDIIIAKAFNKNGQEIGRTKITVEGKANDASYFDFEFDKRTDIGFKNKIILE